MFGCLWDATTCIQCSNFNLLHGFYRGAIAELRTALELVIIGTFGSVEPANADYLAWKAGTSQLGFTKCRRALSASLAFPNCRSLLGDGQLLAIL